MGQLPFMDGRCGIAITFLAFPERLDFDPPFFQHRQIMTYALIELDWGDLGWMLGLLGAAIALLQWQGLALTGQLLWAGGRTILQLIVVGYFLAVVFSLQNPWAVLAVLAIMLTIAAVVAKNRINPQNRQLFWGLWLSLGASTALGLSYSLAVII